MPYIGKTTDGLGIRERFTYVASSGDTSITIEVPSNTGANVGASIVTNYEYEQRLQDKKRQIRLLDPRYIPSVIEEYKILMNESSI